MENTNVKNELKRIADYLNDLLDKNFVSSIDSKNYLGLVNACNELIEETNKFYEVDKDGNLPILMINDKDSLLLKYQNVVNACEKINSTKGQGELHDSFCYIASSIESLVTRDIAGLSKMDKPETLSDIVINSRRKVIDVTGQELKKYGANLSSRKGVSYIENGVTTKGIFTPSEVFKGDERLESIKNKFNTTYKDYKEMFAPFFENTDFAFVSPSLIEYNNGMFNLDEYFHTLNAKIQTFKNLSESKVDTEEEKKKAKINYTKYSKWFSEIQDEFLSNPIEFSGIFSEFANEMNACINSISFNKNRIQIKDNESISERNSAMSMVAGLLNENEILAHSEECVIKDGDKTTYGTIMKFSDGLDINTVGPRSAHRGLSINDIDNPSLKEQVSSLQVIDYLCGNYDRHGGNMLYQFDNGKLVGVVGIDNDCSFPTKDSLIDRGNRNPGLKNLQVIDEKLAERVKLLTPAMLKTTLRGYKLSNEAIDSACRRLNLLKETLDRATVYDNGNIPLTPKTQSRPIITIIPTDKWKDISIDKLANNGASYFQNIRNIFVNRKKDITKIQENICKKSRLASMLEKQKIVTNFKEKSIDIQKLSSKMNSATSIFRGSSEQFKNIQSEMKKLSTLLNNTSYRYSDKAEKQIMNQFANIYTLSKQYIASKEGKENNNYTKNRINVITEIRNFVKTSALELESKFNNQHELEEISNEYYESINDNPELKDKMTLNTINKLKDDLSKNKKEISANTKSELEALNNNKDIKQEKEIE